MHMLAVGEDSLIRHEKLLITAKMQDLWCLTRQVSESLDQKGLYPCSHTDPLDQSILPTPSFHILKAPDFPAHLMSLKLLRP